MTQLIVCRFIQGLGLGAEIVVGYSTMTEFVLDGLVVPDVDTAR
jgi:MFS family permease